MDDADKTAVKYPTREQWLEALTAALRPIFEDAGYKTPSLRVSCGWPSKSIRKRIGECWHAKACDDHKTRHIFVSPVLAVALEVADCFVHELIHACLPDGTGHKAPFKKACKTLGLEGPCTATHAGKDLAQRLHAIIDKLGDYPHTKLIVGLQEKKQSTRMLKLTCAGCGYVVRTSQKWIDVGLPTCTCGEEFQPEDA